MSKFRNAAERIKTALIVVLTVSALFLGWQTGLVNDLLGSVPIFGSIAGLIQSTPPPAASAGAVAKEAARPLTIVITGEDGAHFGTRYDTGLRNTVYDRTSSILGEALGSMSAPSEISEEEWRAALSDPGVYFEYIVPVKLSVLDGWLGAHMPDFARDAPLRRICVAFGEDRNRLFYEAHDTGLFYAADTASAGGRAQELGIYGSNGAIFAFETGIDAAESAPYMLLMPGRDHPVIRVFGTGTAVEYTGAIISALGLYQSEYTSYYDDDDGALVSFGPQFNLRTDTRGHAAYRRMDDALVPGEIRTLTESEMIERARIIAADTIALGSGETEVFFESVEYGAGERVSVIFAYYLAGGRVHLYEDGYAAKITFMSGVVTEMELNFAGFEVTDEYAQLLPEQQALAAAGGEFMLRYYFDTGFERLEPTWCRLDGFVVFAGV